MKFHKKSLCKKPLAFQRQMSIMERKLGPRHWPQGGKSTDPALEGGNYYD